jgi:hypothetical protein
VALEIYINAIYPAAIKFSVGRRKKMRKTLEIRIEQKQW